MERQIELARENLKEVIAQDALAPATRRSAWKALNYIDRQEEIFQPAAHSADEEQRIFALSQVPEMVREEEIPSLIAIANHPQTPAKLVERLRQAQRELQVSSPRPQESRQRVNFVTKLAQFLKRSFTNRQQAEQVTKQDAQKTLENSVQLKEIIEQVIAKELDQRVVPYLRQEDSIEERLKQGIVEVLDQHIPQQIHRTLLGPELDNYQGFVCARLTNQAGASLQMDENGQPFASMAQDCQLHVWLQANLPENPKNSGIAVDEIAVLDGRDSCETIFQLVLDSENVQYSPRRQTVAIQQNEISPDVMFSCTMPKSPGPHEVWIQVLQKNRLIQALPVEFIVVPSTSDLEKEE